MTLDRKFPWDLDGSEGYFDQRRVDPKFDEMMGQGLREMESLQQKRDELARLKELEFLDEKRRKGQVRVHGLTPDEIKNLISDNNFFRQDRKDFMDRVKTLESELQDIRNENAASADRMIAATSTIIGAIHELEGDDSFDCDRDNIELALGYYIGLKES